MTFADAVYRTYVATRKNTARFAQTVTFKSVAHGDCEIAVPVKHAVRHTREPDGTTTIFEQIDVEIDKLDLTEAPTYGDRIQLADDERAYLYAYRGGTNQWTWHCVFERRIETARGARAKA